MSIKSLAKQISGIFVSLEKESLEELMIKVQEEDHRGAFEVIYNKMKGPIHHYILSFNTGEEVAVELVHEVFLKVYQKRALYRPEYKFTTWLWTIARNTTLDLLRKKDPLKYKREMQLNETSEDPFYDLEAPLSDPEAKLIEKSDQEKVRNCFSHLSDPQREAMTLRMVSEMSYKEIAETLESTVSSIKGLIHRGKKQLMECLKKGEK